MAICQLCEKEYPGEYREEIVRMDILLDPSRMEKMWTFSGCEDCWKQIKIRADEAMFNFQRWQALRSV